LSDLDTVEDATRRPDLLRPDLVHALVATDRNVESVVGVFTVEAVESGSVEIEQSGGFFEGVERLADGPAVEQRALLVIELLDGGARTVGFGEHQVRIRRVTGMMERPTKFEQFVRAVSDLAIEVY
jgi:hypothetical protein